MLAIILLAAGASSRMRGGDKLLEPVEGVALLRRQAKQALSVTETVLVCLPTRNAERTQALERLSVIHVPVANASLGMAHSLAAGIRALPPSTSAAMIVPADMPELTEGDLQTMASAHAAAPDRICRGCSEDGRSGHPVVFPRPYFERLAALEGDTGARSILREEAGNVRHVPLPNCHALTDLDTPEDWSTWRKKTGKF